MQKEKKCLFNETPCKQNNVGTNIRGKHPIHLKKKTCKNWRDFKQLQSFYITLRFL